MDRLFTLRVEKPDEIGFTLMATLSLKEWREIRKRLNDKDHAWDYTTDAFCSQIDEMVTQAEQSFIGAMPDADAMLTARQKGGDVS